MVKIKEKEEKLSFMVDSDFEAYQKVMEAKEKYEKTGECCSIEEAYSGFLNYVSNKK